MRFVGYCRVSTNGQAMKGVSVAEQESDMRVWCETHGHELVQVCPEEGGVCGGAEGLADRFAFIEALNLIKAGEAEGFLVRDLDRLSRDVVVQEQLLRDIWAAGGEVMSTRDSECEHLVNDPADPTRKLLRVVMGAVAEWEREKIRLRLQAGRRAKARKGQFVGGKPLHRRYGAELVREQDGKHVWRPVADEQDVITRIVAGRADGLSSRAIADDLNAAGIAPPAGERWYHPAVQRVMQRVARTELAAGVAA